MVLDRLEDDTPTTVAETVYDYDVDSNLVERDITLPGNDHEGLHEYDYDNAGRLISWTFDLTTVDYEWDDAGNRVKAGADTYTYDERNRLLTGPDGDYAYTARGTLLEVDNGTPVAYSFDPLGRLASVDGVAYTYDGLGRVATRNTDEFTYQGFNLDPSGDDTFVYGRSPSGRLTSISDGSDDLLAGLDRHGDLTFLFEADGTITDTSLYDPYGVPQDQTGSFDPNIGYQGDWTDPGTGHVWMGARWYEGSWANFLSRDTILGELTTPISLNRYTYAFANPHSYWDPDGRFPADIFDGGNAPKTVTKPPANSSNQTDTGKPKGPSTAIAAATDTMSIQEDRRTVEPLFWTFPYPEPIYPPISPAERYMQSFGLQNRAETGLLDGSLQLGDCWAGADLVCEGAERSWHVMRFGKNLPFTWTGYLYANAIGGSCGMEEGLMVVCTEANSDLVPRGGIAIGNTFTTARPWEEVSEEMLSHEDSHATQWFTFGGALVHLYFAGEAYSHLSGQGPACGNPLESWAGFRGGEYFQCLGG